MSTTSHRVSAASGAHADPNTGASPVQTPQAQQQQQQQSATRTRPRSTPPPPLPSSVDASQKRSSPPTARHHMNAAVLSNVTYPSPRAAVVAKEAVEAAQLYYDLFFQPGEDGRSPVTRRRSHHSSRENLASVGDGHSGGCASRGAGGRGAPRETNGDGSPHRSRGSSAHSDDASHWSVQTPVNVVDTAYHTFFPPVLSSERREAIVERIVGHRPRAYHAWQWHKAEDYHELHAQNVHHNNAYHQNPASLKPLGAAAATTAKGGTGKAANAMPAVVSEAELVTLETPSTTAPSYPSASPVASMNAAASFAFATAAAGAVHANGSAVPVVAGEGASTTATMASPLMQEMPFELMSQLSMYTIPTSQQGPEYFKKTAEDGTKTLIIFMMGLPARGKTFLAQKICRLLGWHGSRAKVQNIQVAWRRVLLDWEATHAEQVKGEEGPVKDTQDAAAKDGDDFSPAASAEAATPAATASIAATTCRSSHNSSSEAAVAAELHHPPHRRRAAGLAGHNPAHSATRDEVSRVVRDLATGTLGRPRRRSVEASPSTAAGAAGGGGANTSATAGAGPWRAMSASHTPVPAASAAGGASAAAASAHHAEVDEAGVMAAAAATSVTGESSLTQRPAAAISPVCPSMEPFTVTSRSGSAHHHHHHHHTASSPTATLGFSDCASDVAVAGSPLEAALHSQPVTPTAERDTPLYRQPNTAGAAAGDGFGAVEEEGESDRRPPPQTRPEMPAEVLRTRHFRDLINDPSSVARRLYRYVLQSFADDCRLFFQHGGEVVVINDDFVTEELRQEAEQLFRPLASQFFYMEVIRDRSEDPLDFVQCKIRDPMEYPRSDIDLKTATDDFHQRLHFLESVYETLGEAPRSSPLPPRHRTAGSSVPQAPAAAAAVAGGGGGDDRGGADAAPFHHTAASLLPRSYVKIRNASTIETHGISGYLASRIISYVMNLSQVKIQHPIYFVRHGESCYNLEDRIGGNPLLTEQGMRDAAALLEFLASLKQHLKLVDETQRKQQQQQQHHQQHHRQQQQQQHHRPTTHAPLHSSSAASSASASSSGAGANSANTLEVWTSQLRRAIQTAELSERLLNIRTLRWSSLNEIHAGVCEDMTYAEVSQRYPLIDYFRKRSKYTFRYPEGESYQDLVVRLEPVIMELENADKVVVVVAHQAVLRCLLAYFGSTSAESSISVEVPHRTVWRCTYDSKGIASLDELKLDNYEAGFQLPKRTDSNGNAAA